MTRSKGRYHDWRRGHGRKVVYRNKRQARVKSWYLLLIGKGYGLRPYPCTWSNSFADGKGQPEHWHLGHRPKWMPRTGVRQRCWFWRHKLTIWPYYRMRKCIKKFVEEAELASPYNNMVP